MKNLKIGKSFGKFLTKHDVETSFYKVERFVKRAERQAECKDKKSTHWLESSCCSVGEKRKHDEKLILSNYFKKQ